VNALTDGDAGRARTHYLPRVASGPEAAPHSGIREIVDLALRIPECIRLEVGEPDFPTPAHIVQAVVEAARSGQINYTAASGLLSLREKLLIKLSTVNGIAAGVENVTCSIGAVGGIAAALTAILEPGDEVLLPDPAWPNYRLMLACARAIGVPYPCPVERGFTPDPLDVERRVTSRTKVLILNTPCNPTGTVFSRRLVENLTEVAVRHNLYLLSDECYDEILLDADHTSPGSFCTDGRVISAFSFSKTYAMTGWRVGYVVANTTLSDTITKVLESNSSCVPYLSQCAAEAALDGPRGPIRDMVEAYRRRRDLCVEMLNASGILITRPQGAFYIMADVQRSGLDSYGFARDLLATKEVAVAPGTAFGESTRGAVRISLASSPGNLAAGIQRLTERVDELAM
jgi:aspartate aminotransferase/aminotransferase